MTAAVVGIATVWGITLTRDRARIRLALGEATLGVRRAEHVTDFMLGLFAASEGGKVLADTVTARELLSRGVARAQDLAGQPALQAQLLDVVGRLHTQLGDYDRAKPLVEEALGIRRRLYGERHPDVVTSLESLADVFDAQESPASSVSPRRQALALRRQLSGLDDPRTANATFALAHALHRAGDVASAKPLFDEWATLTARGVRDVTPEQAERLTSAAMFLQYGGELDRAESMFREVLAINRALYGDRHHRVAVALGLLGSFLARANRAEEAEPITRQAIEVLRERFPGGHPLLVDELRNLGVLLLNSRRSADAQEPLLEALAMRRRFVGDSTIEVAISELDLSQALAGAGAFDEAEVLARHATWLFARALGDDNGLTHLARAHVGDALRGRGRHAGAERLLLAAFKKFETPKPATRSWRRHVVFSLVRLYEAQGRLEEAARFRQLEAR